MTKILDIDSYVPDYRSPLVTKQRTRKSKLMTERARRIYVGGARNDRQVGVDPKKMLDWRSLERRLFQLNKRWDELNLLFWKSLRETRNQLGLTARQVMMIYTGDDTIIEVHDDGYTVNSAERLVVNLQKNSRYYGDFKVLTAEAGGHEIGRLMRRSERFHRALGVYKLVFRRAIEDRLRVFLERHEENKSRRYTVSYTYIIENDDRKHVVLNDSTGVFSWAEGDSLCAK